MINYPIVEPLQPEPDGDYDVVVGTIGFEERARFLAETMRPKGKKMVAIGFRRQQVLNYLVNEEWYSTHGYETTDLEDGEYGDFCSELVAQLDFRNDEPPRMWVDISSCSRLRLALLIDAIRRAAHPIVVDFVYSISKFSAPSTMRLGNTHVGPVTPNYAGWAVEPNRPSVAIVGLGYEQDKALGAVEHTQASDVWVFVPKSSIAEYSAAMLRANRILLGSVPEHRRIDYIVERPFDCFVILESLVSRLAFSAFPVLFPFGPKIFHLCSILVACLHPREVAVWRVSAGSEEPPSDRQPSNSTCALRVRFLPRPAKPGGDKS